MRKVLVALSFLFFLATCPAQAQVPNLHGAWVGGFWLDSHWVRVNIRFEAGNVRGSGDITFSSYEGVNAAVLSGVKFTNSELRFEIPVGERTIAFDGQLRGNTISGRYEYAGSTGTFGLTRIARAAPESLKQFYGLYRLSSGREIGIVRDFESPNALRYVEFDSGKTGTLWPDTNASFFSGNRLGVSYPIAVRVHFVRKGSLEGLKWKEVGKPEQVGRKIQLEEESLSWNRADIRLAGTLITPKTSGPHPVIIIVPGDFGTSRDALRHYAYAFLRLGIGSLVFDSRGAGESTGQVNSSNFSDLSEDVLAAVALLKTKSNINANQIGLFGFSNSAWTTALAASRSPGVAFLINQSMSGVPPWRQEIYRVRATLRAEGFREEVVKEGVSFMERKFAVARTGDGWDQLQEIRGRSGGERWFPFTNPPSSLDRLRRQWEASFTYDPVPSFERITCPVLAVWGGKDRFVPVDESKDIFVRALVRAENQDYTVKILPNGSHGMFDARTGGTTEWRSLQGYVPEYMNLIGKWLAKRVRIRK